MSEEVVIGDIRPRIQVVGDGVQTVFPFPFAIFKNVDLEVYLDEVLQATGFNISGVGQSEGGTVSFDSAPNQDVVVTLRRQLPIERISDFAEGGAFHASVINRELDYLVAVAQQNAQAIERSLSLNPTDGDAQLVLPSKSARAGTTLMFDSAGAPSVGPTALDVINAQANSLLATQAASDAQVAKIAAEAARDLAQTFDPAQFRRKDETIGTNDIADGVITQAKIDPAVQLGGPSLGANSIIRTNADTISEDITIPTGTNGMSAGPITIADGYTVTVNGEWSIV